MGVSEMQTMYLLIQCLCFVCLLILGIQIKKCTQFGDNLLDLVTKLVMWVAMPSSVIAGYSGFRISASVVPIVLLSVCVNLLLAFLGSRMGKDSRERAENIILFTGFNTGCFPLAFAQSFFGSGVVAATCVFDMVNALFCFGGSYAIASALYRKDSGGWASSLVKSVLRSHIFLLYLLMMVLSSAQIQIPELVLDITGWIAPCTGYLAMLMVGLGFDRNFQLSSLKTVLRPVSVRLAFSVLLSTVVLVVPGLLAGMKDVAILNLLAPFTILSPIYLHKYGLSTERASLAISVSSFLSVLMLSVFSLMCPYLIP